MKYFLINFCLFFAIACCAHPHIYIEPSIEIIFDDLGLNGFKNTWVFDGMYSELIIEEYDKNKNRFFENKEIDCIKEKSFSNVKNQSYFNRIKIGKTKKIVKEVLDFNANIENGNVVYSFMVPCRIVAKNYPQFVSISVYDDSYYISLDFDCDGCLSVKSNKNIKYTVSKYENEKDSFYFYQIIPYEYTIKYFKVNE